MRERHRSTLVRHCVEIAIHCQYLEHFRSTYRFWYAQDDGNEDPPRCRQMVNQIKKKYKNDPSPAAKAYVESLERSYELWHLMSSGSHPTGEGLTQLQDLETPGPRFYGSNYRYDLTMVSFDSGFGALNALLDCYYQVRRIDPSWTQAYRRWKSDLHQWRQDLLTNTRVAHLSTKIQPEP